MHNDPRGEQEPSLTPAAPRTPGHARRIARLVVAVMAAGGMLVGVSGCGQKSTAASTSAVSTQTLNKQTTTAPQTSSSSSTSDSAGTSSSASSSPAGASTGSTGSSATASSGSSSSASGKQASALDAGAKGTYSTNPTVPLPSKVAASIPDSATVISPKYAQLPNGTVVNLSTGAKVTDPSIVGTASHPADPLAKTDGKTFIPTQVGTVRSDIAKANEQAAAGSSASGSADTSSYHVPSAAAPVQASTSRYVETTSAAESPAGSAFSKTISSSGSRAGSTLLAEMASNADSRQTATTSLSDGDYGAYWQTSNGNTAFYNANGQEFVQQAKGVIDVSQWQGTINWAAAKADGVQGAIIRLTYGWGNGYDSQAVRNMQQCEQLGIPFGVYVYSYAYNEATGYDEGTYAAQLLKEAGISESDLAFGVQYDLEAYSWAAHPHPTSPSVYNGVVRGFVSGLSAGGYDDASVYSYTYYLDTALDDSYIHSKVDWVASYGYETGYSDFGSNFRGWQYADDGSVNGISGSVDLDAWGYAAPVSDPWPADSTDTGSSSSADQGLDLAKYPLADVPDGDYYLDSGTDVYDSLNVPAASTANGENVNEWSSNRTNAQVWHLKRNPNGSYGIQNVNSGLWLNVADGGGSGTAVNQWVGNGASAQQWWLREINGGLVLEPESGNLALDVADGGTADGTAVRVWTPNGTNSQTWRLTAVDDGSLPLNSDVRFQSANAHASVLSVDGNSTQNLSRLELWQYSPTSGGQDFEIIEKGNGLYSIQNVENGYWLDDYYGGTTPGTIADTCAGNGLTTQQWLLRYENGGFTFVNANSGLALDQANGGTADGTEVRQWTPNQTSGQTWLVTPAYRYSQWQTLVDGNKYTLAEGWYHVSPAAASSQQLDDWQGNKANGAVVDVYQTNGDTTQNWYLQQNSWNGTVSLENENTGTWLTLGGDATAGNNVSVGLWQGNGQLDQDWIATYNSNGTITLLSAYDPAYALNLPYGVTSNGTLVQEFQTNGSQAQQWKFNFYATQQQMAEAQHGSAVLQAERTKLANTNINTLAAGYYFVNEGSNIAQRLTSNSASVGTEYKNETSNQSPQVWRVQHNSWNNTISIQSLTNNEWLSVVGGDDAVSNGEAVALQPGNGQLDQDWIATQGSDSNIVLHSAVDPSYTLTFSGGSVDVQNGSSASQQWLLTPTVTPTQKAAWLSSAQSMEADGVLRTGQTITLGNIGNNNFLMEDQYGRTTDGAIVDIYQANGTASQEWTVLDHADGSISLQNARSGEWLDNSGYVADWNTAIIQWPGEGRVDQQWIPVRNPDGSITLHSWLNPYFIVDLRNGALSDLNIVRSWGQNGAAAQAWVVSVR